MNFLLYNMVWFKDVLPPWVFNICINKAVKELNELTLRGAASRMSGEKYIREVSTLWLIFDFGNTCERRKLKIIGG